MAEGGGFEPTNLSVQPDYHSGALNYSTTSLLAASAGVFFRQRLVARYKRMDQAQSGRGVSRNPFGAKNSCTRR
jgi:hypothetical protein